MKKLYFLDEEEKSRVLSLHESATKRQYLSEATEKGGAGYVDPATDTPEAKIAREFYKSAFGAGTNEGNMLKAIQSIKSAVQFWQVNELVKNLPSNSGKLDIAGVINDEMGLDNLEDVKKIVASLKTTAGITATYGTKKDKYGGDLYKENDFKITSQPINTPTKTFTDAATACIKQFSSDVKTSSKPDFVYTPLADGSNLFFGVNYSIQYQTKGKSTIYGNWSCKGSVLNIIRKDGQTWSKAQGGWKKSTDKTVVVDPAKTKVNAQQELATRLKQSQKSLGLTDSGVLDNATLQSIITKISPRPQVQPVESSLVPVGNTPVSDSQSQLGNTPEQLTAMSQQLTQNANRPK